MINNCTMVGRLTADPELKYTPEGTPVATCTLAINRPFRNKSGDTEADFINVVIWRKPAENTANYMKKGGILGVIGRWTTRNYENSEGKKVYVNELTAETVQFISSNKGGNSGNSGGNTIQNPDKLMKDLGGEQIDIQDDDLPF